MQAFNGKRSKWQGIDLLKRTQSNGMLNWNDFNQYPNIWYSKKNYRKYFTHATNWTYECNTRKQNLSKNAEKNNRRKSRRRSRKKIAPSSSRKTKLNTNRQINICLPIDACRKMRSEKPKRVRNVHQFRTLHVTRAPNRIKKIIALSHFCALNAWCECAHYLFFISIIYVELLLTKAKKKNIHWKRPFHQN